MDYKIKSYDHLPDEALSLRIEVFVDEQGFFDEFDDTDKIATHFVLYNEQDLPLATCRIFEDKPNGRFVVGRLCVRKAYRGLGIGTVLLSHAEKEAKALGGKTLCLHAQYRARAFYKNSGYTEFGEMDYEQDCPHIWLEKTLD
ncbi:MAG: GNAT family N-acetyltransferase [Clostridia bacterium]|nr:GNAT family N-acetyltransferase [Clostridia bacterium]